VTSCLAKERFLPRSGGFSNARVNNRVIEIIIKLPLAPGFVYHDGDAVRAGPPAVVTCLVHCTLDEVQPSK